MFQHYIDRDLSLKIGDVSSSDEEFAKVEERNLVRTLTYDTHLTHLVYFTLWRYVWEAVWITW